MSSSFSSIATCADAGVASKNPAPMADSVTAAILLLILIPFFIKGMPLSPKNSAKPP